MRLLRIVKAGAAVINWETVGLPFDEQNAVIKRIIDNIDKYSGCVTISGFPEEIACRPAPQAIKCQAGTHLLYVTNTKKIYPCACTKSDLTFLIGSINDLDKIKQYLEIQQDCLYNEYCLHPLL